MDLLWREPGQTVREVEERLRRQRQIAHTTVLTTLDRMHRKGYLDRKKRGRAFVYWPRYGREEFECLMARKVMVAWLGQVPTAALSAFAELVGADANLLDQVEVAIWGRRRK